MPDFDDSYLLAHTINLNTETVINQLKKRLTPVLKDGACAAKPVNAGLRGCWFVFLTNCVILGVFT